MALSMQTLTKHILKNSLLPAAQEWNEDDKASCAHGGAHRALVGAAWGCGGGRVAHTKGDDMNLIENLWALLDERLEGKKFKTEKGMEKSNPSPMG